jgi:hypothetical protein
MVEQATQQGTDQGQGQQDTGPAPVPYDRFKQSRQALQEAKAHNAKLERELAELKAKFTSAKSTSPNDGKDGADDDSWLDAVFGGANSKGKQHPQPDGGKEAQSLATMDPVLESIKMEYAERQLDATLKAFSHVPEEVMLPALASGLDPETIAESYEHLKAILGKTQSPQMPATPTGAKAKSAPPPRPASAGAGNGMPPAKQKPQLPDNQYDRVEFVAKLLEGKL